MDLNASIPSPRDCKTCLSCVVRCPSPIPQGQIHTSERFFLAQKTDRSWLASADHSCARNAGKGDADAGRCCHTCPSGALFRSLSIYLSLQRQHAKGAEKTSCLAGKGRPKGVFFFRVSKVAERKCPEFFLPNFVPDFPPELYSEFPRNFPENISCFMSLEMETTENSPKIPKILNAKSPGNFQKSFRNPCP